MSSSRPYRRIFASYSHEDTPIVEQFEPYADALGDEYLRDVTRLRAGQIWTVELQQLITEADIFQLFWSWNSIRSPFVRQEWQHALSLGRPTFVRPTYWQDPLPYLPEENLPPPELERLHFKRMYLPGQRWAGAEPVQEPMSRQLDDTASEPGKILKAAPSPTSASTVAPMGSKEKQLFPQTPRLHVTALRLNWSRRS